MDFIDWDVLIKVVNFWVFDKDKQFGEILVVNDVLFEFDCQVLEQMVDCYIEKYEGNFEKILVLISLVGVVCDELVRGENVDVQVVESYFFLDELFGLYLVYWRKCYWFMSCLMVFSVLIVVVFGFYMLWFILGLF